MGLTVPRTPGGSVTLTGGSDSSQVGLLHSTIGSASSQVGLLHSTSGTDIFHAGLYSVHPTGRPDSSQADLYTQLVGLIVSKSVCYTQLVRMTDPRHSGPVHSNSGSDSPQMGLSPLTSGSDCSHAGLLHSNSGSDSS